MKYEYEFDWVCRNMYKQDFKNKRDVCSIYYSLSTYVRPELEPQVTDQNALPEFGASGHVDQNALPGFGAPGHVNQNALPEFGAPGHVDQNALPEFGAPSHVDQNILPEFGAPGHVDQNILPEFGAPGHIDQKVGRGVDGKHEVGHHGQGTHHL